MLDSAIAEQLGARGCDVEAVQGNPQLEGLADVVLMRAALALQRSIVTDNVADFARHHRDFLASGDQHAGIVLARLPRSKRTIGMWVRALEAFIDTNRDVDLSNTMIWLD